MQLKSAGQVLLREFTMEVQAESAGQVLTLANRVATMAPWQSLASRQGAALVTKHGTSKPPPPPSKNKAR